MRILVLPDVSDSAAANMATDLLLLERPAGADALWFRHYGWTEPAFTFGISQRRDEVRRIAGPGPALVRRPTGGGVVSHLNDWTYSLVAPAGHPLAEARAADSYRAVHEAVATALLRSGVPAALVPCPRACASGDVSPASARPSGPGVCFVRPEIHDVVRADDGRKLAGAAQKRTRDGLLFQGSVDRAACGETDWRAFDEALLVALAQVCDAEIEAAPLPEFDPEARREALARFSSEAWNGRR